MEIPNERYKINPVVITKLEDLFYSYDFKQKQHLDESEIRNFFNDLRIALGLDDLDETVWRSLKILIDKDKYTKKNLTEPPLILKVQNDMELEKIKEAPKEEETEKEDPTQKNRFALNFKYKFNDISIIMEEVLCRIVTISKLTKQKIESAFKEFAIDENGTLTTDDIKLLCHLECDRLGVMRSDEWQVQYLLSVMDDDGDGTIDLKEFHRHYREVIEN